MGLVQRLKEFLLFKFDFMTWYSIKCQQTQRQDDHEAVKRHINNNLELAKRTLRDIVETSFKTDIAKRILIYGEKEDSPKIQKIREKMRVTLELIDNDVIDTSVVNTNEFAKYFHCIIGASSETGELAEALSKYMMGHNLDKVNLGEEIGDIGWYLSELARFLRMTLKRSFFLNAEKLGLRYKGGYSDKKAVERNTSKERVILEGK